MKLEKYLADYLATEIERLHERGLPMDFNVGSLQGIIKQGLDAFESTENVKIKFMVPSTKQRHGYMRDRNEPNQL